MPFLASFLRRRHPRVCLGLVAPALRLDPVTGARSRSRALKSRVIRMIMRGESRAVIDACAETFVNDPGAPPSISARRTGRARGASRGRRSSGIAVGEPGSLCAAYRPLLGFERTLCTEIRMAGRPARRHAANRRIAAAPKSCAAWQWLRSQYPGLPVIAYGNSASDLDHMREADGRCWSTANSAAPRGWRRNREVAVADWT